MASPSGEYFLNQDLLPAGSDRFRLEAGVARRCLSEEIEFALIKVGPAGNARL
jgi:hypothetical protein